jgi:phosphoglycerate dehydrogenase-like enzyme
MHITGQRGIRFDQETTEMSRIVHPLNRHLAVAAVIGLLTVTTGRASAQEQSQQDHAPAKAAPLAEGDIAALEKQVGLIESQNTARELVSGWKKPKTIMVPIDQPARLAWLQEAVPDVKLIPAPATPSCRDSGCKPVVIDWSRVPGIADVDAIIGARCSEAMLQAAKNLKWFHSRSAGVDEDLIPCPSLLSGRYLVTDGQKLFVGDIAGNAVAFMVSLMRCVDLFVHMDINEEDRRPNFASRGWNIGGRTVLVVGLGAIGTQVAKMAHGLDMKVIATRETSHQGPDFVDYVGLSGELPDLIGKADVIVVTAPLTPETKGLFNASMFARAKKGALFINVARGEEVVQGDLIAALRSGQLGGAAMDVTDPDPLPSHDPLFSAPNIIVATHHGAPSHPAEGEETSGEKGWLVIRENMRRYAAGEKMLSVVDLKRGY